MIINTGLISLSFVSAKEELIFLLLVIPQVVVLPNRSARLTTLVWTM